jgi:hypothetical protein
MMVIYIPGFYRINPGFNSCYKMSIKNCNIKIHQNDVNSFMTSHFTPKERAPCTQKRLCRPQSWYKHCEETKTSCCCQKSNNDYSVIWPSHKPNYIMATLEVNIATSLKITCASSPLPRIIQHIILTEI